MRGMGLKNEIDNLITQKIALGLQNSSGINGRIEQFTPGAPIDSALSGAVAFIGVKGRVAVNVENKMVFGDPQTWRFYFQPMGKESHHLLIQADLVRALQFGTEGVRTTLSYFTVDYTVAGEAMVEDQQIKALNNKAGSLKGINFSAQRIVQAMGCEDNAVAFEYHPELSIQDQYAHFIQEQKAVSDLSSHTGVSQLPERFSPVEKQQKGLSHNRCLLCWCGSSNVSVSQSVNPDRVTLKL